MWLLILIACEIRAEKPDGDVAADTAGDSACAPSTFWSDLDGDGFGDAANAVEECVAPAGYVANADDCNDGDAAISPSGIETCDTVDQDCDGTTDEDAVDAGTWYPDRDQDGLGNDAEATIACEQPPETIAVGGDCDDYDRSTGSGSAWYSDDDGDTWGGCRNHRVRPTRGPRRRLGGL